MIFPWQQTQWDNITKRYRQDNLPHSLLIAGPNGTGKTVFADQLAKYLLCQGEKICGQCQGCHWFDASTHPDFYAIAPEEGKSSISINQIRELVTKLTQTANAGGYQVVIIHPAEKMTTAACNALLKTLEEPTGSVVFMLVTDQRSRLPATIISRCQLITIPEPSADLALSWLSEKLSDASTAQQYLTIADGRVMLAKRYSEQAILPIFEAQMDDLLKIYNGSGNPLKLAASWQKNEPILHCELLLVLVTNMIRCKLYGLPNKKTAALAGYWQTNKLFDYLTLVQQKLALLKSHANPNVQLLLEGLLVNETR